METAKKILVVGSGAVKIAEAAEFDYSGTQALKALKEEGIETILVNPNVATIQTSYKFADKVYLVPLKPEFVAKVIEAERPEGILLGFGGQTALSLGVKLYDDGILQKYGVKVLGTPVEGIKRALSRSLFREAMAENGVPTPPSIAARSIDETVAAAEKIGYPVMVRVSFNLGGAGSFIAWSRDELDKRLRAAFAQSETGEVLVEKYLHHWKEIEFEVVRDAEGNEAAVACLENLDPMGVHTGESIVMAPCQTLTDFEYQLSREISIGVARAITLIGEGNVQVALNPRRSEEAYAIETNPRMSRSSALASKATGYPLAYIAAKLALGYRLYEILNKITGITSACFEPSLDYVVVKVPRWDLDKFPYVERSVGTEMKSIGEVMAIGRTFLEALQKAIRMLDIGEPGLVGGRIYENNLLPLDHVLEKIRSREPYWPIWVAKAFKYGVSVDTVYELIGVDKYFLEQIRKAVEFYEKLKEFRGRANSIDRELLAALIAEAKRMGFSDEQIAAGIGTDDVSVRRLREVLGVLPVVKQIDTLAAEWPAKTNYLYLTYNGWEHDVDFRNVKPKIVVLGAGGFRVGVSVEFDWAVVSFSNEARKLGYEVVVLNYNPETVSTDWDMNEKLYFDEITVEKVLDIVGLEKPAGVVAFLGGQISNNIAWELEKRGVMLLGTKGSSVHRTESRALFSQLLDELGIKQPPWIAATNIVEVMRFVDEVGFPVLVRPSYVLGGVAMSIAWSREELLRYVTGAVKISSKYPAVISKFIDGAIEFEIDAVGDGETAVGSVIEHVEYAGVHSGDATMSIPFRTLPWGAVEKACGIAMKLNEALSIKGPYNVQFLYKDGEVYVIELNLRASRSMPFTSKVVGYDLMMVAVEASLKGSIGSTPHTGKFNLLLPNWFGVKSPQFSWTRLRGAYPLLGPEMRSVGEVAALGNSFEEALLLSWLSVSGNRIPSGDDSVLIYNPTNLRLRELGEAAKVFSNIGYRVLTIDGMDVENADMLPKQKAVEHIVNGKVGLVITAGYAPEKDYVIRRLSADLMIPLILDQRLALEISKAIAKVDLSKAHLREMKEFWVSKEKIVIPVEKPFNKHPTSNTLGYVARS